MLFLMQMPGHWIPQDCSGLHQIGQALCRSLSNSNLQIITQGTQVDMFSPEMTQFCFSHSGQSHKRDDQIQSLWEFMQVDQISIFEQGSMKMPTN